MSKLPLYDMLSKKTDDTPPSPDDIATMHNALEYFDKPGRELVYVLAKHHYVASGHAFEIDSDGSSVVLPFATFPPKLQQIIVAFVKMHSDKLTN